jgi:hypothetical protein
MFLSKYVSSLLMCEFSLAISNLMFWCQNFELQYECSWLWAPNIDMGSLIALENFTFSKRTSISHHCSQC